MSIAARPGGFAMRPAGIAAKIWDIPAHAASAMRLVRDRPPAVPGRATAAPVGVTAGDHCHRAALDEVPPGAVTLALDNLDQPPGGLPRERGGLEEEVDVEAHRVTLLPGAGTLLRI